MQPVSNNKRIAKNTLFLYIRTIFTMVVSLYTSRIVLATLGVDDFGIYNVVGGIVMFLSFLNTSMAGATQRFLNFEFGKNDLNGVKRVFSNALIIPYEYCSRTDDGRKLCFAIQYCNHGYIHSECSL